MDLFGGAGVHARALLGRQRLERRRRQRQHAGERAELHGGLRRPVLAAAARRLSLTAARRGVCYGEFKYDDANTLGQEAYSLDELARGGLRGKRLFGEAWVRNAFDTRYIPMAFPYPGLAPSGFVGESGRAADVRAARGRDVLMGRPEPCTDIAGLAESLRCSESDLCSLVCTS